MWSNYYAIDYIKEFPLTGSGGGSFYVVFPNFQAPGLKGFYTHADNDYLEFAAELGLPATAVLIAFVALAFYSAYKVQVRRHTALYKGAAFSVIMTILWAGIHSSTDFNLQIPANALVFVTLAASPGHTLAAGDPTVILAVGPVPVFRPPGSAQAVLQ